ncbi:MAG TPA: HAD-IB family phosphatase [Steroidobacteraceae bacterium]|nr:HAD-IB family phosphatase [Steroidobacteraceae bacterium]
MGSQQTNSGGSVAVFDLDGTLTFHDTLMSFLLGFALRHPARFAAGWRLAPALADYARTRDRGQLKSRVIRQTMGGARREEISAYANDYVRRLEPRGAFRAGALAALQAHRTAGDHLVLLSASPDLYVPRIGEHLSFERTLCTEVGWDGDRLTGELKTPNRRGTEKVRCLEWLRTQYPGAPIVAYGNSESDLPHMQRADRAVLVNANRRARRLAAELGIATADWK